MSRKVRGTQVVWVLTVFLEALPECNSNYSHKKKSFAGTHRPHQGRSPLSPCLGSTVTVPCREASWTPRSLPLRFVRYDISLAHFRGIKRLPPGPTLPDPPGAPVWLPAKGSSAALVVLCTAAKESQSLHADIGATFQAVARGRATPRVGSTDLGGDNRMLAAPPAPRSGPAQGTPTWALDNAPPRRGKKQASSPLRATAANGRCLIKALAISLARSPIPFCKQIRWETLLALGGLLLKKTFSPTTMLLS